MFNLESLGSVLLASFFVSIKPKLVEILQEQFDRNVHEYKALLFLLNAGVERLKAVVDKTETKLDDAALADIQDVLQTSAAKNGITL